MVFGTLGHLLGILLLWIVNLTCSLGYLLDGRYLSSLPLQQGYSGGTYGNDYPPALGYYDEQGYPAVFYQDTAEQASNKLDDIEKQILNESIPEFVAKQNSRKLAIQELAVKTAHEEAELKKALTSVKKSDKKRYGELMQWLKKKQSDGKVFEDDVKLLEDITLVLSKIEAAKYYAMTKLPIASYDEKTARTNAMDYMFYWMTPPQYRYLTSLRSQVKKPDRKSQVASEGDGVEPQLLNLLRDKESPESGRTRETEHGQPAAEGQGNRTEESERNVRRSIQALENIQSAVNNDAESIYKLVYKVKELVGKEIAEYEGLVSRSKILAGLQRETSKRSSVVPLARVSADETVRRYSNHLEESKRRLWDIMNVEWVVTQIEAAKYLAELRLAAGSEEELKKQLAGLTS